MNKPLFIVVDGSNCYYSKERNGLYNNQNRPSGAIFGLTSYVEFLQQEYQPAALAVVFDARAPTFRHQLYPEYKAQRDPMPPALQEQLQPTKDLLRALGFALVERAGVEADDVIGSLTARARAAGYRVLIVSNDKDMAQLLSDDDVQIRAKTGSKKLAREEIFTAANIKLRFGENLSPALIPDFLALKGDAVDNIIGLSGVNKTTLIKLLKKYDGLAGVLAHKDEITGVLGEKIRANADRLALNRQLTAIKTDLEFDFGLDALARQPLDLETVRRLCDEYNLNVLASKYLPREQAQYRRIASLAELEALIGHWRTLDKIALDTETTGLDYFSDELVGLSFADGPGSAYYLPLAHRDRSSLLDAPAPENLPRDEALRLLRPLLEDEKLLKIGQNLKFDQHVLRRYGLEIRPPLGDTMLLSYVLNSTACKHNLDALARYYLNHSTTTFEEIAGKGAQRLRFDQIDLDAATHYAAEDADITLRLYEALWPRLAEELRPLYLNMELPLAAVLATMEERGILIDEAALRQQSANLGAELAKLEQQAHSLVGHPFNLGSPKQLQEILFQRLELPVLKKTPQGQPSTDESVLRELAERHELPRLLLGHRHLAKLKSTYTDTLPTLVNPADGRLHTSYQQAVTSTGRLSSSNPNLQNIPIKSEQGQEIRAAFIARPGWQLLAADYSQIELRVMAHFAQDEGLMRAFRDGVDIHSATASEVFEVPLAEVNRELRRRAKSINFGLIYGMGAFGLARQLKIGLDEAESYIERYFQRYPKVQDFMERSKAFAREHQYVETLCHRRIHLLDINHKNKNIRAECERVAINAPIQGTAADIIKIAMLQLQERFAGEERLRLLLQVHDELVFEIEPSALDLVAEVSRIMREALPLTVPLEVETGLGPNWLAAH